MRDAPTIEDLAATVEERAAGADPAARLRAAIGLGAELADLSDALIGRFVTEARGAGLSWTEIGQAFGTSKQAVQQRFGAGGAGEWPGRWTAGARAALERAAREAEELGHGHVGTEHVLLALTAAEHGTAAEVLADLAVTRERVLATSCIQAQRRLGAPPDCRPLMPRLKQALDHSRRLADGLGASDAGAEHLLAGIVSVPDSMGAEILRRLGAGPGDVRAALAARLGVEPRRLGARRRRRRRLLPAAR